MVRLMKNAFVPINRIPYEVLSIIPDYWAGEDTENEFKDPTDKDLITLTHVCHDWRELFISRPSLWTRLDCMSVEKTRVYIERSKSSPLEVHISKDLETYKFPSEDALPLTIPHLGRVKSLSIAGFDKNFVELINKHFNRPAPFLEKLKICFYADPYAITATTFDRNLSSLQELCLIGVLTDLPWRSMGNLTKFDFCRVPSDRISVTQLLDFFEHAPLLSIIRLRKAFPDTSNAPPDRVVPLFSLKKLHIIAQPAHSILLNHLSIPSGALLVLEFGFDSEASPIPVHLPKDLNNLNNLSPVTSINLSCRPGVFLRLNGPSGGLYVFGISTGEGTLTAIHRRVLRSLHRFCISVTERFMITAYSAPTPLQAGRSPPLQTLLLMNALCTLILIDCHNVPFISALNPCKTPSGTLVCPKLEELVLYVKNKDWFCINELLEMVKERSSRGAGLSTITIFSSQEFVPAKKVLKLRDHVSCVEYRLDDVVPVWDEIPNDIKDPGYESDW